MGQEGERRGERGKGNYSFSFVGKLGKVGDGWRF